MATVLASKPDPELTGSSLRSCLRLRNSERHQSAFLGAKHATDRDTQPSLGSSAHLKSQVDIKAAYPSQEGAQVLDLPRHADALVAGHGC